jgi:ribonuclease P protein component
VAAPLLLHVVHVAVYALACDPKKVLTLPRRYRLSRREGFSRLLQQRAQINSWFAVHSDESKAGHARLGVTVTKRVVPAATKRNVAKRLIRECFRSCARHGVARDVVIRLRKPLEKKDHPVARATLNLLLRNLLVAK